MYPTYTDNSWMHVDSPSPMLSSPMPMPTCTSPTCTTVFAFHPPPLFPSPSPTLTPTHPTFPASHFASLPPHPLSLSLPSDPLASPSLPHPGISLLPPLTGPLLGTLIDARQQVLLIAAHALSPLPAPGENRYLFSHLALSCQEALEKVNQWLRESDTEGEWGTGSQAEERREGVVRLLDLELFLIRLHVTSQSLVTSATLNRLWAFYASLRRLTTRSLPPPASYAPQTLAFQLVHSLEQGTVLHASDTPLSTIRALVHACLLDPSLLEYARRKQVGVSVRGWETEQPEDVELGLRRLGLGVLVSEGKVAAKGLGEGEGRRELRTPVSPVVLGFS
ncbi:hypothetical protein DACRYDRAFT_119147 [Dacryopinax primogenitus]|uniref:Uncharacterized protein n=1 Tax=Dacryopinax primogenitus (strain DJM 731) TaxID=1858805 RepID=M5FNV3_DACPD|nr:uncharacterized protein DACRYDRAFT_119147 [Dacryopinax primogenitus]EJT97965.1 hypothetical protein DACRYDRAFT_119147 [Dacryopinax primogenitus]